jgi:hypothetical protein
LLLLYFTRALYEKSEDARVVLRGARDDCSTCGRRSSLFDHLHLHRSRISTVRPDTSSSTGMVTTGDAVAQAPIYRLDDGLLVQIFEDLTDETGKDLSPMLLLITVCKLWWASHML